MLDPNTDQTHEHTFLFNSGADQIRSDTSYDTWQPMNNYASRAQKTAQNYANYRSWNSMGPQINESKISDDDGDGVCSPPLWKTTGRTNNYRNLSPASQAQAIARGQRELMEMVKNMPESCYELSLKDLVEHNNRPLVDDQEEEEEEDQDQDQEEDEDRSTEILVKGREINGDGGKKRNQINERKKLVMRTRSIDSGGFLLKVFPISLGLGSNKKNMMKKKKSDCVVMGGNSNNHNNNISAKVSPNPCKAQVGVDASVKGGVDSDWWKMKRLSVSSERSESGVSSINSGSIKSGGRSSNSTCSSRSSSSSSSSTRRKSGGGCWSFFLLNNNKRRD